MAIKLIWCQDQNGGIGHQNQLPWKIKAEMDHFRAVTLQKTIVMGRKTFESIGRALPNRVNVVLTKNTNFFAENVIVYHSIETLLKNYSKTDLYVIGGKEIYQSFYGLADEIIVSKLRKTFECDTFLNFDFKRFNLISSQEFDEFVVEYYKYVRPNNKFTFYLEDFSGSLDLLWALIKEKKYDLKNLDVKDLTEQYLDFINQQINRIDIDIAADYLYTASTLINLKAKMLFADSEDASEDDINEFLKQRDLLVQRLLEYKKIRKGISWLRKKQHERLEKFIKKPENYEGYLNNESDQYYLPKKVNVHRLKDAFEIAIGKMKIREFKKHQIFIQELSIEQVEKELKFYMHKQNLSASTFYNYLMTLEESKKNLKYFVVVFLTILTLVRSGQLMLEEHDDDLYFVKTTNWIEINEWK